MLETNAPASAGTYNFLGCNANVSQLGDHTGCYGFWLQNNFAGTVSPVSTYIADTTVDYDVRVDNASARFMANDFGTGQGRGICNIRAVGQVQINNSSLGELFSLDVPAGGSFTASQSIMSSMPHVSQAGFLGYTNCIINNSFIAADMNETPYRPAGMTVVTNNLAPVWVNAWPSAGSSRDPAQRAIIGWHLQSGSNFLFHVTDTNYSHGARPNVTIEVKYLEDSDGTLTVSYDSQTGMRTGATYALASTNVGWRDYSFNASDARFAGTNGVDIMLTASNADPVVLFVLVQSGYLGVPPQILPTHYTGPAPVVSVNLIGSANLLLSGNVGAANGGLPYWMRSATNVALPLSQWDWVSTNVFNPDGSFSNALPAMPGTTQRFYRLQTQ